MAFNETSIIPVISTPININATFLYFTTSNITDRNIRNHWITYCIYAGALLLICCGFCICLLVYCVTKRNNTRQAIKSNANKERRNDELKTGLLDCNNSEGTAHISVKMDLKPNIEHVELVETKKNIDKLATILNAPDIKHKQESKDKSSVNSVAQIISSGVEAELNKATTKNVNNAKSKRKKKTRKKLSV